MKEPLKQISWAFKLGMRDARSSKLTLAVLITSIVIGIAGVVAIGGFRNTVTREIDRQARNLVGADLVVSARSRFSSEAEQLLEEIPGERARELTFASMAFFPKGEGTRLVQVNAVSDNFPLYGELETEPAEASRGLSTADSALVDGSLLLQYGASVGDTLRIGAAEYRIIAEIKKIPGVLEAQGLIAPRVYIPISSIDRTGLLKKGSRVRSREYFRLPATGEDTSSLAQSIVAEKKEPLSKLYLTAETVADRQRSLSRVTDVVAKFLSLSAFIALALGGLGVGSAAQLYVQRKNTTVAILRCLGARIWQTVLMFFMQLAVFGAIGIVLGLSLGIAIQFFLPKIVGEFLPVTVGFHLSVEPLLLGAAIGALMLLVFSAIPVLRARLISPLAALRLELEGERADDPLKVRLWIGLLIGTVACASLVSGSFQLGVIYSFLLLIALAAFGIVGSLLIAALSRPKLRKGPYAFRQGVANLYRPYNQTRTLVVLVGMGVFLLVLISFSRQVVLDKISYAGSKSEPNIIIFDVQPDQQAAVRQLTIEQGLEIIEESPIISMRLAAVNGKPVAEVLSDPDSGIPRWSLTRTYRSTYRDSLADTEELLSGTFIPRVNDATKIVPISIGERIAKDLNVNLGDSLVFDVQGVEVSARISSVRKIDWQRVRPNFFVVFPMGVLEAAPQFSVFAARVDGDAASANYQREAVQRFPNISIIDLRLVQRTVDAVLSRLSQAVQFLGLMSMLTAALVLFGAVLNTKDQRSREYSLLKVLGSSRRTILIITAMEYGIVGLIAAVIGVGFAAVATLLLATFVFDQPFQAPIAAGSLAALCVVFGCVVIGLLASIDTYRSSPANLLRV